MFLPANILPEPCFRIAADANGALLAAQLRRLLDASGFRDPLLWIYGIAGAALVGRLPARLTIYDCLDEWSGYLPPGNSQRNVRAADEALCRRVDLVFVGSKSLLHGKRGLNANTHWVPHAADFAHFSRAAREETAVPDELARLPKPVIGLVGTIEKRIDVAALERAARRHPEWSVALVGPVWDNVDVSPLRRCANVHFLGNKVVAELPAYIKGFDVCLIPYLLDDFTRNIYPLKLHEYLASGKPIVSTPIPAVLEYNHLVHVAAQPAAFVDTIERALCEDGEALRRARIEVASRNTWEDRVAVKSAHVNRLLSIRKSRT